MSNVNNSDCKNARPYRLENKIQNYPWGTRGQDAFIPKLLGFKPVSGKAYAELWLGVHPNAPSSIIDLEEGSQSLSTWISEDLHNRLSAEGKYSSLPYLFKVLSAGEALSIQAHPNKSQAEYLHQHDPKHYPDDNHKPEIAIAIDHLDALIGFISDVDFFTLLDTYPELNSLLSRYSTSIESLKDGVQALFKILEQNATLLAHTSNQIFSRLSQKEAPDETEILFMEQYEKHGPEDAGLVFLLLLNRIHLGPGEAVFLAPGVPHAYLKGNIIECMANSDNVVRLGLTSKFCDAETLQDILVYDTKPDYRVSQSSRGFQREYSAPVSEFKITSIELPEGKSELLASRGNMSMFLLLEGKVGLHWDGRNSSCTYAIKQGQSFITPASLSEFQMSARMDSKIYRVEIP
jgi:mannose-6-phosphate isomerase